MRIVEIITPTKGQWMHDQLINGRIADFVLNYYTSLAKDTNNFTMAPYEAFSNDMIDMVVDELVELANDVNLIFKHSHSVTVIMTNAMLEYFSDYLGE